jgi:hypothetical protein
MTDRDLLLMGTYVQQIIHGPSIPLVAVKMIFDLLLKVKCTNNLGVLCVNSSKMSSGGTQILNSRNLGHVVHKLLCYHDFIDTQI